MRKIEFRGKRKDNGEWVYGHYVTDGTTHWIVVESWKNNNEEMWANTVEVIPETVGQYCETLKAYEGDNVEFKRNYGGDIRQYTIRWKDDSFMLQDCSEQWHIDIESLTIDWDTFKNIGDIYDNGDLLKEKE